MGTFCSNVNVRMPSATGSDSGDSPGTADMSATSGAGAVTRAAYVIFAAGASWHGKNDRAWIAWNCEKRYG